MLYAQLDPALIVSLDSDSTAICTFWQALFAPWLLTQRPPAGEAALHMKVMVIEQLPPPPSEAPSFITAPASRGAAADLAVYREDDGRLRLHFGALAVAWLRLSPPLTAEIILLNPRRLHANNVEDIFLTALAPLLRRRGYFLLHAFGAVRQGAAMLLVGTMGRGKTTTGLNLLLNGWQLLANDVVLLQRQPEAIYALPTPSLLTIRPATFDLLHDLRKRIPATQIKTSKKTILAAGQQDWIVWADPTPVRRIYLPQIEPISQSRLTPTNHALALAHLMEESLDRWDPDYFDPHLHLLQQLTQQAQINTLHLGSDMAHLAALLRSC